MKPDRLISKLELFPPLVKEEGTFKSSYLCFEEVSSWFFNCRKEERGEISNLGQLRGREGGKGERTNKRGRMKRRGKEEGIRFLKGGGEDTAL